ncbi:MAG: lysophospholipid acyltransferase family protein [Planctomycetes bacterium]|nr:lysophospholipid acyltransferase family protein [Planctomycetota bacterium]
MNARRTFKRARRRLGGVLLRSVGPQALTWLSGTWKKDIAGLGHLDAALAGNGFLIAMWHGRMIVPVEAFRNCGWNVLVSPSEDGDLSEGMLQRFGFKVVRGSSSRGGARALREMLALLDTGAVVVITPDGPRGPMHSMNPGLAWMARATGRPVIPFGNAVDRAWHLGSWDRFTIPKVGARIALTYGAPIHVARTGGEEELARKTEEIRAALLALERESFARLGVEPDF